MDDFYRILSDQIPSKKEETCSRTRNWNLCWTLKDFLSTSAVHLSTAVGYDVSFEKGPDFHLVWMFSVVTVGVKGQRRGLLGVSVVWADSLESQKNLSKSDFTAVQITQLWPSCSGEIKRSSWGLTSVTLQIQMFSPGFHLFSRGSDIPPFYVTYISLWPFTEGVWILK